MSSATEIKKGGTKGFSLRDTNVTKGIAICILMIHHCFMSKDRFAGFDIVFWPLSQAGILKAAGYFKICVPIFAFLSAYGMTLSLMKVREHYARQAAWLTVRRLLKLYAGFWFAYAVCYVTSSFLSPSRLEGLENGGIWFVNLIVDLLGFGTLNHDRTLLGTFWYISLAVLQIIVLPFLYRLSEKVHPMMLILLMLLLSRVTHLQGEAGNYNYLLLTAAGILSARFDLWGRIRRLGEEGDAHRALVFRAGKAILALFLMAAGYRIFYFGFHTIEQDITMTLCTMIVVYSVVVLWSRIPLFSDILAFLGFYSMNIYYIHNFYRINWLHDFLFSLRYWWAVAGMLLLISLLTAVVVEYVKKIIGYTNAMNRAVEGVMRVSQGYS